jgi:hypothetical protein
VPCSPMPIGGASRTGGCHRRPPTHSGRRRRRLIRQRGRSRDSRGTWDILPHGGASALLVSRSRVETGMPVPGIVKSYLVKNSLPHMMRSIRDEVERRAKVSASVR